LSFIPERNNEEEAPMKGKIQFLAKVMVLCLLAGPAFGWYPSTTTVELGTATW